MEDVNNAYQISQNNNTSKAKEEEKQMISLLQKSQESAEKIDDNFLESLHPEIPLFFKNKLINGQQLYIKGITEDDPAKQIAAVKLLMECQHYWEINGQSIIEKIENR